MRSANGDDPKPTVTSFLQLFRLLTLYYPTKAVINANVDAAEKMMY
jgi:hypothetical protein